MLPPRARTSDFAGALLTDLRDLFAATLPPAFAVAFRLRSELGRAFVDVLAAALPAAFLADFDAVFRVVLAAVLPADRAITDLPASEVGFAFFLAPGFPAVGLPGFVSDTDSTPLS